MINRGGEKIVPREVEDVIFIIGGWGSDRFRSAHETLGEDFAVAVVLREKGAATEPDSAVCCPHLAEFKIPGRVVFVDEIPKSATGKQ